MLIGLPKKKKRREREREREREEEERRWVRRRGRRTLESVSTSSA